jgi:hypothetical protein
MGTINDVREQIAQKIEAEGFRVTTDPRNLNTPCVLIGLPRAVTNRGMNWCNVGMQLPVSLVAPAPGTAENVSWLLENLPTVMQIIGATTAEPDEITQGENELPAYTTVLQLNVNLEP